MPVPGDLLADRYRILAPLGAGGMATVHRARDERLGRDVAVKVLLPNLAGDPATAERFEREARAMAAVAHPGLVAVFDVDAGDPEAGREPFVVMELCSGGSLADRLGPDRPMAPDELVPILVAIADALSALHHAGLVHRDVKPSNILFTTDKVKLADFGLVRSGGVGGDAADLTEIGTAIGTLAYLSPERLRGDPGGPPADVFALATIAHLGLTGSLPRPAGSVRDVIAAAPFRAPAVSTAMTALGPAFDAPVLDGLAVEPSRRPDAMTLGSRLATALGTWTRAGRPGAPGAATGPASEWHGRAVAAGFSSNDDDATTAIAIPIEPTARHELIAGDPSQPPFAPTPATAAATRARPGEASRAPILAVVLLAAAVVGAVAFGLASLAGPPPGSASGTPRPSAVAGSVPSSLAPAASSAAPSTPASTVDPALAALDAVDAAIDAARGGKDGLKGKEANDLLSLAGRVRRALDSGDRAGARDAARDLADRVDKLSKDLGDDAAAQLRSTAASLLDVLGS